MKKWFMIGTAALIAVNVAASYASLTTPSQPTSSGSLSFDLGADTTWSPTTSGSSSTSGTLSVNLTAQPTASQVYFVGFTGGYQVGIVGSGISYFGFESPETAGDDGGTKPSIASVPVPGAILLGAFGLVTVALRKRR